MKSSHSQTLSKIFCWLSLIALVFIPLILAAIWLLADRNFISSGEAAEYFNPHTIALSKLDASMRMAGLTISLLTNAALLYGLWHLRKLFQCFLVGNYFSKASISYLKRFALGIFLTGFSYPLGGALLSLVLSSLDPQQSSFLMVTAGDQQLALLFIGGVLLAIASIMGEGRRLEEEIQQFV